MSKSSQNPSPFDSDLAVVIGINEYQNGIAKLKTAKSDAEKLANILKNKHGYQVELFIDEKATSNNIKDYLKIELPKKIKPDNEKIKQDENKRVRLLFYFAGHGTAPQGEDGEAGYLLPQDADVNKHDKYLSMKEIHDVLIQLGCHHLLIILDCCYAGAFRFGTRDLSFSPEELSQERYKRYQAKVGQVITSAAYDQKALDILKTVSNLEDNRGTFEKSEHSPFAGLLLKALEEGDADYTKDGITTVTKLNLYLSEKLRELTQNQSKPQISRSWCLPKLEEGEFFFETGEFDPSKLPEAINLNKDNNPYRGLESFGEAHSRLFFGRSQEIDTLYKRIDSNNQPLTVVLGISGAGKSSLVKAGLIAKLRENPTQWRILEPIRPGSTPFKALARAVLALENTDPDFEPLKQLDAILRKARRKDPNDNNLNNLFAQWRITAPEDKLLLIIKNFDRLKELCGERIEPKTLENLRKIGLSRSRLVLDNFDKLIQANDSVEQKQLLNLEEQEQLNNFYKECSKKIQDWSEEWQEDGGKFGNFVKKYSQYKKILLVIDQFEELITQCNLEERNQFLNALQAALKSCPKRLRVVLTLRDDFRHDFENSEQLQEYWKQACFSLTAMGREQLRQAIEQPALAQVLYFEDKNGESLVNQLLDDIGDTSGVLPLLSFTLSELYCKYVEKAGKNDRTLTWEDYDKLGNVTKALTGKADEEYENLKYDFDNNGQKVKLDPLEAQTRQTMLRWVMLRMVSLDGGVPTKRAVVDAELVYADEKSNEIRKLVIDRFVNARLFVRGTNHQEEKYIEPAHDVLIREWSLLKEWLTLEQKQENLVLQKRLAEPTFDWNSQGCTENSPLLWNQDTGRIERLKEIVNSNNCWLNKLELRFFEASVKEHDRQARDKLEKEVELYTELSQRLFTANDRLDAIAKMIEAGELLHKSKVKISKYKELHFMLIFNHFLNESREINSINIDDRVNKFSFNQNAQVIATVSGEINEKICLMDWQGKQISFEKNKEGICDLVFSPDGETLVAGRRDGVVQFYTKGSNGRYALNNIRDNTKKHISSAYCVNFSPDGNILVSAGIDKEIVFWDGKSFKSTTLTKHRYPVKQVIFNPKYKLIAFTQFSPDDDVKNEVINIMEYQVSHDGTYQACLGGFQSFNWLRMLKYPGKSKRSGLSPGRLISWKPLDDRYRPIYPCMTEGVQAIDFHPNGEILVAGGVKGELQIWFINKNEEHKILKYVLDDQPESISDVAFSPDGQIVASSHTNGIINLWDTSEITEPSYSELQKLQSLAGHKKNITKISFTLDSKRPQLLSSSHDGTVKFWAFRDGFGAYRGDKVRKVSFSANNQIVTTVDRNGKINFWQANGKPLDNEVIEEVGIVGEVVVNWYSLNKTIVSGSIPKPIDRPLTLNFSPNEDIFVIANEDNTIGIWELNIDTKKVKLLNILKEQPEKITAITFSIDGKFFALGSNDADGEVKLWKIDTNQDVQAISTISNVGDSIDQMSLSNDGEMIGVVINSKTEEYKIKLYRRLNDKFIDCWCSVPTRKITALRFYDENKIIVSIDKAGCIQIWSLKLLENETLKEQKPKVEQALEKIVEAAAFGLNGEEIAMATRLNDRDDSYRRIQTVNLNLDSLIKTAMERHPNYLGQNSVSIIPD